MYDLSKSAVRLVALLAEITETEIRRRDELEGPIVTIIPLYFHQKTQAEIDKEKMAKRVYDKTTAKFCEKQKAQRKQLGQLAKSLAPEAKKQGVDWMPVIQLFTSFDLKSSALENAEVSATMLEALLSSPAASPTPSQPQIDYIDMDQAAALVNRNKRTLERYQADPMKKMPLPIVQGAGGKKSEWDYAILRHWLEKEFGKNLPDRPPHAVR